MNFRASTVIAAMLFATSGCGGGSSPGGLDAEVTWLVTLNQASEVPPPTPTTASGTAQIVVYPSQIDFQLRATGMTGITMAHIHNGAAGVAGPVVVTLFQPASPTGPVNGIFASGTLTEGSLSGGWTMATLKTLLLSGNAYVNVHTTTNPLGEIRGQIR